MSMGTGTFYDGATSARQTVTVELADDGLRIGTPDGRLIAEWPYHQLESLSAPNDVLRLGRRGSKVLARLEIIDPTLAGAIDAHAAQLDRGGTIQRRQRVSVVAWSVAATISLILAAWFGVPAIADRLAPIIPHGIEQRLGNAVDTQVRAMLDNGHGKEPFDCGQQASEQAGRAALDKLMQVLSNGAALPFPLRATVVRRKEANAISLPGSQIYVFQGLLSKTDNVDELAGVIAHEIGHIAHRDGTKSVLQGAGLSFLFGMLLGDFLGGGAVVFAAKTVLQSSYSREVETAADTYGVNLMNKIGANGRALGTLLAKIGGATEPGMTILLDHPQTSARVVAINKLASATHLPAPLLTASEWTALKHICGDK
ncbi:MAG TPA: M48 family metallopeptidase [Pseudolabrys sp.]|nr:M48 family metallopeptidase [Pseudolabrys sp.]